MRRHNERLEFVGDAVLNCVVAATLYERFPAIPEGELSRVRASLVKRDTLARLARAICRWARRSASAKGELKSGGADRPSILADALEALFGAVFVDAGYDAARAVIERVYAAEFVGLDPATLGKDPKTRLQEWLQARRIAVPDYAVTGSAARRTRRRSPSSAACRRWPSSPRAPARTAAPPSRTPRRRRSPRRLPRPAASRGG